MTNKYIYLIITFFISFFGFLFMGGLWYDSYQDVPPPLYAFASDRNGTGNIFVVDSHHQTHNLTNHAGSDWDPTWRSDGLGLAYTSHQAGNSDIWVRRFDGFNIDRDVIETINLTNHPSWDYSPTWAPNNRQIAFVSERDGDPEIFVQHLEARAAIQLTFNEEMDRLPSWSPDGKYIAFAAVRNGVEQIHRIRPDGTDEQIVTQPQTRGTSPAWSPDSQKLAFIGWDDAGTPGIYVVGPDIDTVEQLYQGTSWLGSLDWSADGAWLTFTAWKSGNHELMVLPVSADTAPKSAHQLTQHEAWDDFLTINPASQFQLVPQTHVAQAAAVGQPSPTDEVALGINLADLSKAYLVNDLGLGWAKSFANWATIEHDEGQYRWDDPDNIVRAFSDQELNILMRVHGTPTWNRPPDTHLTHPPLDLAPFAQFMTALATRYKGQVQAYEIWNEPNLNYEWGYQPPDPAAYTELLKVAYTAIKQVDPDAIVVSGGLSTTGNGSDNAYGDVAFLEAMYQAGAKGYFDAFGSHPYSFGQAPDVVDPYGLSLARVVEQREIMVANGDSDTPIWITETGWVLDNSWDLGEHNFIGVTQAEQAQYASRAFQKIVQEWSFVEGVFLFNLDFSTVSWYPSPEPMRWYAILNPDRTPRPAYTKLRQMYR